MTSSSFLVEPGRILVADASVLINLNATRCAAAILRAFPTSFVLTTQTFAELRRGTKKGHTDAEAVDALIEARLLRTVNLGASGSTVFASLVDGSAVQTLDDGEAATIAYAHEVAGVALIDERKATTICGRHFSELGIASTIDILTHDLVSSALCKERQITAIRNALEGAQMHVPGHQLSLVIGFIGEEDAANYSSLPRRVRARY